MKSVTVKFSDNKLATVFIDSVDDSISDSEIIQTLSIIDMSSKTGMLQQASDMIYMMGITIVDVVDYPSGGIQCVLDSTIESFKDTINSITKRTTILSVISSISNNIRPYGFCNTPQITFFSIIDLMTKLHFM